MTLMIIKSVCDGLLEKVPSRSSESHSHFEYRHYPAPPPPTPVHFAFFTHLSFLFSLFILSLNDTGKSFWGKIKLSSFNLCRSLSMETFALEGMLGKVNMLATML